MEPEAKWNGSSDQVEFSRMSPRSQGFTKLPGQKTCGKSVLLFTFVLLISAALWGTLLFLFITRYQEIVQDLGKLRESCVYHNDSGILTVIGQLQETQLNLKTNVPQLSKTLNKLQEDQTTLKSKASQFSQQLNRFEEDGTAFRSQVLNEKNTATQAREKLQEEIQKLWIEFQRANGWTVLPSPPSPNLTASQLSQGLNRLEDHTAMPTQGSICTKCPENWQVFQKKCYFFGKEPKTWAQAKYACINLQGRLVSIKSREEQVFLNRNANKKGSWIGLRDLDIEGIFLWMDGSSLNYTNWGRGEPNNQGQGEDCVAMRGTSGLWNDANCRGQQDSWICEKLATC
ncbi:low affinity immunoglobulin epsilon Fc receptor isoform X1 [Monodelphis domestica]|uniref:low affinity immunoglobulin epsilon Fc receptor isoform X1 n=1 Tax=Monodelphis domestica TaxID=13616 RepID=UPI0024E253FC|nr:low affinity immunoglobulin epsilon Fc receptor isoform X1 [Monodelphis domestica]